MSNCEGFLGYFKCPICGMPINRGRCPGGCDVRVEIVALPKVPDFLKDMDPWVYEITVMDKSDSYYPLEEQFVTFMLRNYYEKKQRKTRVIALYIHPWSVELIDFAIDALLVEYTVRRECDIPRKVVEEYGDIERLQGLLSKEDYEALKKKVQLAHRLTPNRAEKLKEAAKYYEIPVSTLVDAFAIREFELRMP